MAIVMEPAAPWLRELNRVLTGDGPNAFVPPADVIVDQEAVTVYMDVPGLRADDLEVELEQDLLSVRGARRYPYGDDDGGAEKRTFRRIERAFGRFERSLRVPGGLNPDDIEAALADGVLTLRMPRPQPPQPKRITIGSAQESGAPQTQQPEAEAQPAA
jgi:HSP20 family protein